LPDPTTTVNALKDASVASPYSLHGIGLTAGVVVTFILGVWNAFSNFQIHRKTIFINTVTTERMKWIEKLRNNISKFVGATHSWTWMRDKEQSTDEIKRELDELRYLIRLQLNPNGSTDQKIQKLISDIPDLACKPDKTDLFSAMDELISETQKLLKDEWDRVKEEAKHGVLRQDKRSCLKKGQP